MASRNLYFQAYREANKKHLNRYQKARKWHKYGLTEELLGWLEAGGCAYTNCQSTENLQVDHDHSCCDRKGSCGKCVRGVLCKRHNLLLGAIESDAGFTAWALNVYTKKVVSNG